MEDGSLQTELQSPGPPQTPGLGGTHLISRQSGGRAGRRCPGLTAPALARLLPGIVVVVTDGNPAPGCAAAAAGREGRELGGRRQSRSGGRRSPVNLPQ